MLWGVTIVCFIFFAILLVVSSRACSKILCLIGIIGLCATMAMLIVFCVISSNYKTPTELLIERAQIESEMIKESGTTKAIEERIEKYNAELKKTKDFVLKQEHSFWLKDFIDTENLDVVYYFNDGKYTNTSPPTN